MLTILVIILVIGVAIIEVRLKSLIDINRQILQKLEQTRGKD